MRAAVVLPTDLFHQRAMPVPTLRALRMVAVLRGKGADIRLVEWLRWRNELPAREERGGLSFERITMAPPSRGLAARARFLGRLTRRVREAIVAARPDGIALQDEELLLACVQAKRKLRVPLFFDSQEHWLGMVARERPLEARLYALLERYAARHLEHVYTAVPLVAEHFRRLGCEATVLYNSPDAASVRPHELPREEAKRRLGLAPESFVLGFTGSVAPDQGLEACVEALRSLPRGVHVFVVGGPPEALRSLEAFAAHRGVADRVRTMPAVAPEEAVRVHCAFDAGLLTLVGEGPNFTHRLSYKFFDYMAIGLPVIASDYPELRRVGVEEVGFALPAKPGDASGIAEAVERLRGDEGLRQEMARRARGAFERTYSGERQKERLRASHGFWR